MTTIGAPFRFEAPERAIQEVAIGDRASRSRRRPRRREARARLRSPPAPTARDVETGIDDEATQPGIEPVGIAQRRQVPPGSDEPVLDRVARELGVPKDQTRGGVQARDLRPGERFEGVMIAPLRSLDQVPVVHDRLGLDAAAPAA